MESKKYLDKSFRRPTKFNLKLSNKLYIKRSDQNTQHKLYHLCSIYVTIYPYCHKMYWSQKFQLLCSCKSINEKGRNFPLSLMKKKKKRFSLKPINSYVLMAWLSALLKHIREVTVVSSNSNRSDWLVVPNFAISTSGSSMRVEICVSICSCSTSVCCHWMLSWPTMRRSSRTLDIKRDQKISIRQVVAAWHSTTVNRLAFFRARTSVSNHTLFFKVSTMLSFSIWMRTQAIWGSQLIFFKNAVANSFL